MKNLNITKEKWVIDGDCITTGILPTDETICDINPNNEYPTVFKRNKDEARANMKLITAAPDMFNVLSEMTDYIIGVDSSNFVILRIPIELSKSVGTILEGVTKCVE